MNDPSKRRIAILGATSGMAQHTARLLAPRARLALVARNASHLEQIAADLRLRGSHEIVTRVTDLAGVDDPDQFFASITGELGGLDAVLVFHGVLGDQLEAERDVAVFRHNIRTNFSSAAELAISAARHLHAAAHPQAALVVVGSVAGDRGRASNYIYGAAKGALALVCQGLAHEYAGKPPRVVLVKPGFVDTPMTQAFAKSGLLWAKPEKVAAIIARALESGGPIVYAPWFWRWIMLVIRLLPQWMMNRLRI